MNAFRTKIICSTLYATLLLIPLTGIAGHRGDDGTHDLMGPAFSDPTITIDMPDEWKQRPIKRIGWAEGSDIAITLDQHLYPALLPIINEYASEHKLKIAVQEGTCGISAGKLSDKEADIGGFCCPTGSTDRLPGLTYHTLAIASIALIVHPENPIVSLDEETSRAIFMGKIRLWTELDPDYPTAMKQAIIRPVGRLHCKARPGHWRLILDNDNQFSPRLTEVSTIPDMISAVAENRDAIGYETLWMTENFINHGQVKVLKINGVDPRESSAVSDRLYPFYRVYNISTWSNPENHNQAADKLVEHLRKNMYRVDPKYGLIPFSQLPNNKWRFEGDELVGVQ